MRGTNCFEGLDPFNSILQDPVWTLVSVGEAILGFCTIRNQEMNSVHVMQQALIVRILLIHDLLMNLENKSL